MLGIENGEMNLSFKLVFIIRLGECVLNTTPSDLTPALSEGEGVRVDVSGLAAGVYFVRVDSEVGMFVKE